ncbi:putative inorganic phosphate cotransporter [Zeugodacus cucurbitae]|uniref:putative inorganic phosphate cotransporter n=1 Tax=Zeugodacus cucurbitae TaxID=28588 RepID=UPI0005969152|nr:putative inorganic phosphate cotransporter [Zeugodacus cucurbitae]
MSYTVRCFSDLEQSTCFLTVTRLIQLLVLFEVLAQWSYNGVSKILYRMETNVIDNAKSKAPLFGARHVQCILIFLGLSAAMTQRVNLSVAIVAMMDKNSTNSDFEEYQWSEKTKSYLLSSFFWGYFVTQIPGSQLAHKFGGKIILLCSVALTGLLALLTPLSVRLGDWQLLCALRVCQGLIQASTFSAIHTLLSKWIPAEERGSLGTFCYTGLPFGSILIMLVSGWIASSSFGWPGIFYFSGLYSIIWGLVWYLVGASAPSDCKWMCEEERLFIEAALVTSAKPEHENTPTKTPWLKILTSVPFWVILVAQSNYAWGFWTMLTEIPSYMKGVLGRDIKSNALMSATPYLANVLLTFVFCVLADFLIKRGYTSVNTSRKLFNTIGFWVPVVPIILLGYMRADQSELALAWLIIAVGVNTSANLGFLTNHIDLSPNFAGILMGVANCAANVMSLLAPLTVGFIVTDAKNVHQWRIVFYIASGMYFIGNLLFILFGQTKIQAWNYPKPRWEERDHIQFEAIKMENEEM